MTEIRKGGLGEEDLFWEKSLAFLVLFQLMWFGLFHGLIEQDWNTLWDRVIRCAVLMVWLRVGFTRGKGKEWFSGISHPLGMLIILVGLWKVLGMAWSTAPLLAYEKVEDHFWLICFFMVLFDVINIKGMKAAILKVWPLIVLMGVLYGLYQWHWAFPEMRREVKAMAPWENSVLYQRWLIRVNSDEVFGLRFYPNLFGLFCAMGFLGALLSKKWTSSNIIIMGFGGVGVLLSGSKSALLFGSSVAIFFWAKRHLRKELFRLFLPLAFLGGFLLIWVLWPRVEDSVFIRWEYWKATWAMLQNHPFGVGVGNFNQWYSSLMGVNATEVSLPHNDHLQAFAEQGWIGGALHVIFWFLLLKSLFNQKEGGGETHENESNVKVLPAFLSILAYLILFSLILKLGPMDLPVHGWAFLAVVGFLGFFWLLKGEGAMGPPSIQAMFSLFLLVAFVDFPMEDGPFMSILLALVMASGGLVKASRRADLMWPKVTACILVVLGLTFTWLHQQRVVVVNEILGAEEEDLPRLVSKGVAHPNSLAFWREVYRKTHSKEGLSPDMMNLKRSSLEFLTRLVPGKSKYWEELGHLSHDLQDRKVAWLKAVSLSPMQPRHAFNLGEVHVQMGDLEIAKKWYFRALERHRYANSKLDMIPDMELHLLQVADVQKAETFVIP